MSPRRPEVWPFELVSCSKIFKRILSRNRVMTVKFIQFKVHLVKSMKPIHVPLGLSK